MKLMRAVYSALLVAGTILTASSAGVAAPVNASMIKQAADEIVVAETVHCRSYGHWHRWGYGRGCAGGVVIYRPRFQYGQAYLGYRGVRPPSKWEAKGFCPPGQAKKGNC